METNILLENGTNELEVLEFKLNENHYGINVAKIREILSYQPVTPVPNANPNVEGIFMPRDQMISVISLKRCLGLPEDDNEGLFIITNFNSLHVAFHVDQVIGIHRLSWTDIITPNATMNSEDAGVSTGVVRIDGKLVVILDFEKIVTDISPETGLKVSDIEQFGERDRSDSPIMIAEDSALLSKMITECLKKSGYTSLIVNPNGQEAWDLLCKWRDEQTILEKAQLVITDIEMPQMDGHRLTKLIKTDDKLKDIPVVIFSSTINDDVRRKGEALGADAQLTKPEIGQLVAALDKIVGVTE